MVGIVDYNAGNIKSVERALFAIGSPFVCAKNPAELKNKDVDRLIFPGVGEAAYAMQQLKAVGFDAFLKDWVASDKPLMGICLGSQIIFDWSDEGGVQCLGLVPGTIRHFSALWQERNPSKEEHENAPLLQTTLKVPHMGWNDVTLCNGSTPLVEGIPSGTNFYFVHSYVIQPDDPAVIKGYAHYGALVPAIIEYKSITAFQFHPEKSGEEGLRILRNFTQGGFLEGGAQC